MLRIGRKKNTSAEKQDLSTTSHICDTYARFCLICLLHCRTVRLLTVGEEAGIRSAILAKNIENLILNFRISTCVVKITLKI